MIFQTLTIFEWPHKRMKKTTKHMELLVDLRENRILSKETFTNFTPIIFVKTIGYFKHKFVKKDLIKVLLDINYKHNKVKIVYVLSFKSELTKLSHFKTIEDIIVEIARENGINVIEALIVNKRLTTQIMNRENWDFIKKIWFKGRLYRKQIC